MRDSHVDKSAALRTNEPGQQGLHIHQKLLNFLDGLHFGVSLAGPSLKLLYVNTSARRLLSCSVEQNEDLHALSFTPA